MGKQVVFYAIGSDEEVVLDFVVRTGGRMYADWSDSPVPWGLEALGHEYIVYLARTDDPDEIRLRQDPSGWRIDDGASYVVEFRRCRVRPNGGLSRGRLYTQTIPPWTRHPGELAFVAWTNRLLATVRRAFPPDPETKIHWGPDARSRKWPIGPDGLDSLPEGLIDDRLSGWPIDDVPPRYEPAGSIRLSPDHQRPGAPFPEWVELGWVSEDLRQVVGVPLTLLSIAAGDIVRIRPVTGTQYHELEIVERSGHATVQAAIDRSRAAEASAAIRELAARRGWRIEMWLWSLFAVDVPPGLEVDEVVRELIAIEGVIDIDPVIVT